jgi:hypothetical protein
MNRGALNPIIRPEQGLPPIPDCDRDRSFGETFRLHLMTKLEVRPSSLRACSSKLEPAHPERHAHQLKVGNAEASQLLGETRVNTGYHTLSARSDLCPAPEETSNQGSDGLHHPWCDFEVPWRYALGWRKG